MCNLQMWLGHWWWTRAHISPWCSFGPFGSIWKLFRPFGTNWDHLRKCKTIYTIWNYLGTFVTFSNQLGTFESFWEPFIIIWNHFDLFIAFRQFWIILYYVWPLGTIWNHLEYFPYKFFIFPWSLIQYQYQFHYLFSITHFTSSLSSKLGIMTWGGHQPALTSRLTTSIIASSLLKRQSHGTAEFVLSYLKPFPNTCISSRLLCKVLWVL